MNFESGRTDTTPLLTHGHLGGGITNLHVEYMYTHQGNDWLVSLYSIHSSSNGPGTGGWFINMLLLTEKSNRKKFSHQ